MSNEQELTHLRSRVAELEKYMDQVCQQLNIPYEHVGTLDEAAVIQALKARNLIEAVKIYREMHGVSLADAKAAVEAIQARL